MSTILTSDKLIRNIKKRGFVPNDQVTFTDDELLETATDEITIGLMEDIISVRGDYLVYHVDVPLIEGVTRYDIPARAHGNKLRSACITNVQDSRDVVYTLNQVDVDALTDLENYWSLNKNTVFYLENNKIVLCQDIIQPSAYNLRLYFYMRPNKLVLNNRAGVISSITDGTESINGEDVPVKILSFLTLPKHFSSSVKYDITANVSPNKITNYDLVPVSVNLTLKTLTFKSEDLEESLELGQYVTIAEETIVPNLPTEYHPVVAQATVVACMEYMNDDAGFQKASVKLAQMKDQVFKIVRNRVEGSPKKIKQRGGTLRNGLNKNYRRW